MNNKKIILIIPAYNEEKSIGKVISECKKYCDEIIVIDDGSYDRTKEVSEKLGCVVIRNRINKGLGFTIKRGYQEALKRNADIVIQIDADGQYTTDDIPKLLKPILEDKADMVLASRFKGGIKKMPISKKIGNNIGTVVTRIVSGYKVSDAQTGFRAIRKEVLEEIQPSNQYTYVQEMIIKVAKEGWRIKEVPSFFKERKGGESRLIISLYDYTKKAAVIILRSLVEYHPLTIFGVPALILFSIGFIIGLFVLYNFYMWFVGSNSHNVIGTTILAAFFMISGLILFSIGLISDMTQTKYKELKEKIRNKK